MTKYSFPPLISSSAKILILGSLPGEESLKQVQYYAHPRNAFWKIMFTVFNIALWDMVHSGIREGSLDSDIKNEIPNDIEGLLNEYQGISTILLNGKKAEAMYRRYFNQIPLHTITLPSTSPANARLNFEEKLKVWKEAINLRSLT